MSNSVEPLHVSPYLMVPCRDLRCACMALRQHAHHQPRCAECSLRDLCRKPDAADKVAEEPSLLGVSWPAARVPSTRSSIEWRFVTGDAPREKSTLDVLRTLYRRASTAPGIVGRGYRRLNGQEIAASGVAEAGP